MFACRQQSHDSPSPRAEVLSTVWTSCSRWQRCMGEKTGLASDLNYKCFLERLRWICPFVYRLMIQLLNKNKHINKGKAPPDVLLYRNIMEAQSHQRDWWRASLHRPPKHQLSFSVIPISSRSLPPCSFLLGCSVFHILPLNLSFCLPFQGLRCPLSPEHFLPGLLCLVPRGDVREAAPPPPCCALCHFRHFASSASSAPGRRWGWSWCTSGLGYATWNAQWELCVSFLNGL